MEAFSTLWIPDIVQNVNPLHFLKDHSSNMLKLTFFSKFFSISVNGLGTSHVSLHKTIPCN